MQKIIENRLTVIFFLFLSCGLSFQKIKSFEGGSIEIPVESTVETDYQDWITQENELSREDTKLDTTGDHESDEDHEEESELEGHSPHNHEHEEPVEGEEDDSEGDVELTDEEAAAPESFEHRLLSIIDGDRGAFYSCMKNMDETDSFDLQVMNPALSEYQTKVKNLYSSGASNELQEILQQVRDLEKTYQTTLKIVVSDNFTWLLQQDTITDTSYALHGVQTLQSFYKSAYGLTGTIHFDLNDPTASQDQTTKTGYAAEDIHQLYSLFDLCNNIVQALMASDAYPILLYTNVIVSGIVLLNLATISLK